MQIIGYVSLGVSRGWITPDYQQQTLASLVLGPRSQGNNDLQQT